MPSPAKQPFAYYSYYYTGSSDSRAVYKTSKHCFGLAQTKCNLHCSYELIVTGHIWQTSQRTVNLLPVFNVVSTNLVVDRVNLISKLVASNILVKLISYTEKGD